jgi:hypothetical protein
MLSKSRSTGFSKWSWCGPPVSALQRFSVLEQIDKRSIVFLWIIGLFQIPIILVVRGEFVTLVFP